MPNIIKLNPPWPETFKLRPQDRVRKKSGSEWAGLVVGWYSTKLTPEGYAVESEVHAGSVQIYPVGALELISASGETVRVAQDKAARLERLLNPRMWDLEMNEAWHRNLPDVEAAFRALRELL
jgi:R67 dihydrofolate reductase